MDIYHKDHENNRKKVNKIKDLLLDLGNIEIKLKDKFQTEKKVVDYLTKLHTDSIISYYEIMKNTNCAIF